MTVKAILKKIFKGRKTAKPRTYVREDVYDAAMSPPLSSEPDPKHPLEPDVDLSPQKDLENYAKGLSVSKKSLEQLISSGLLMPDELQVAEKIVRFMYKKDREPDKPS